MFAICRALLVAALGVGFVGTPFAGAEDKKVEKPNAKPQPGAESAKTIVIQIDASKLPPDVLKQLLQLSEKKPAADSPKPGENPKPGTKPTETPKPGNKPDAPKAGENPKPGAKPGDTPKPGAKPGTEPNKPGAKPGKAISLTEAIAIAEKTTQGTVVKAEREDEDGAVQFELEVIDSKGAKSEIKLDAAGNLIKKDDKKKTK